MRPRTAIACIAGVLLAGATLAGRQTTSAWSGVYTNDQAVAGEKLYFARCASCHGDDLGGVERAPALAGIQFLETWHGQNLRRLL